MNYLTRFFCLCTALFVSVASGAPEPAPVQVLVLGTYHFGNPGQDLHNMQVDDVRTPAKQAELAEVAARLAKFQPTKIAVEALSDRPDLSYAKYETFKPEMLTEKPMNACRSVSVSRRTLATRSFTRSMKSPTRSTTSRSARSIRTRRNTGKATYWQSSTAGSRP